MKVENYSHLDKAVLVDSNGEKYAVGEDSAGYLMILTGGMHAEKEDVFWVESREHQVMIPTETLKQAISQIP